MNNAEFNNAEFNNAEFNNAEFNNAELNNAEFRRCSATRVVPGEDGATSPRHLNTDRSCLGRTVRTESCIRIAKAGVTSRRRAECRESGETMVLYQGEKTTGAGVSIRVRGAHDAVARFTHPMTRMLLASDGLTTPALEALVGRALHVRVLRQDVVTADEVTGVVSAALTPHDDAEVVVRRSCLVDTESVPASLNYVVSVRHLAAEWGTESSSEPIGPKLAARGAPQHRQLLWAGMARWLDNRICAAKAYVIHVRNEPLCYIRECFNPDLIAATTDIDLRGADIDRWNDEFMGGCTENFQYCDTKALTDRQALAVAASAVVALGFGLRPVVIGRIAGEYAKPRSRPVVDDGLVSCFGDMINSHEPNTVPELIESAAACARQPQARLMPDVAGLPAGAASSSYLPVSACCWAARTSLWPRLFRPSAAASAAARVLPRLATDRRFIRYALTDWALVRGGDEGQRHGHGDRR